jgi:hypothetical protein
MRNESEHESEKWQMGHNVDKCKTLHLGNHNPGDQYTMNSNSLVKTSAEKDLGVTVDEHMKFHVHTARVVSKAFQILAVVNKSFVNLDEFTLPLLYKTLVRPHLEYGNVIWGPHFKMDHQNGTITQGPPL